MRRAHLVEQHFAKRLIEREVAERERFLAELAHLRILGDPDDGERGAAGAQAAADRAAAGPERPRGGFVHDDHTGRGGRIGRIDPAPL